jgi:prefoldin subunit 5
LAELDARKTTLENAKSNLETIYAKTLGKSEKEIAENQALMEELQTNMAAVDASFTSFNGTVKSIKQAIDAQLNGNGIPSTMHIHTYIYVYMYIKKY